jgi:hypothetical protein
MRKDSRAFNTYIYYNYSPEGPQTIKIILDLIAKIKKKFSIKWVFFSRQALMRQ